MSDEWVPSDYVARAMSTRQVRVAGTDHITQVTREALEGAAAQVSEGAFLPMTIEHLDYIPPIGRWHSAEVVEAPDGEFELELRGSSLRQLVPAGDDPTDILLQTELLPEADHPPVTDVRLNLVGRNYSTDSLEALIEEAPFEVEVEEKWSHLPPLIWTLSIPVVWGACKFTGAFFEALGKESAESFARWLRAAWSRSREPDRDRMLVLRFELGDGTLLYGFIPSEYDAGEAEENLLAGLKQANTLAGFAGLQRERGVFPGMERAAFIFKDGGWHLAWWTDGAAVYRTHWFDRNLPDPAGYLGRPLLDDGGREPANHGEEEADQT
jgi:hypothetical protein